MKRFFLLCVMMALVLVATGTARAEFLVDVSLADHLPCPAGYDPTTGLLTGTNPATGLTWQNGDTYHLAFLTSTSRDATSANIADYNTFVSNAANSTGSLVKDSGVTWNAIVSVIGGPDARTNTGTSSTVAAPGYPIFLLDSTCIATSYGDLWDGKISSKLNVKQTGATGGNDNSVWTGTSSSGTIAQVSGTIMGLGNPESGALTMVGSPKSSAARWIYHSGILGDPPNVFDAKTAKNFYALSEPLTIAGAIPEPGTLALLGMALLGLGWYAWRKRVPKIAVAAIIAFGLAAAVQAETISIAASDNAWVDKNNVTSDPSEAETLNVRNRGTNASTFTYLRFDISPLAGGTVTSASLDLYWLKTDANNTVYVCALNDLADGGLGNTETSWTSNMTWNTRLTGTANLPNAYTSGDLACNPFYTAAPSKLVSFDLTCALPWLLESDTNHQVTLILSGSTGERDYFASLANTGGYAVPTLTVTGEGFNPEAAIPEPGTIALLGMALLGVGWYAWRKRR